MKAKDVREWSNEELAQRLEESKREIFNLRLQQSTGQMERPSRLLEVRRDIARMNTILTERTRETK